MFQSGRFGNLWDLNLEELPPKCDIWGDNRKMANRGQRNRVIVADSGALFCAHVAQLLGAADDMFVVAQCASVDLLCESIAAFPGSIVVLGASLLTDTERLRILMDTTGCQGILITDDGTEGRARLEEGFRGMLPCNVEGQTLIASVRRVAAGEVWLPVELMGGWWQGENLSGAPSSPWVPQNTMHQVFPALRQFSARSPFKPAEKFGPQSAPLPSKVKRAGA
jgi:DNA-binding NarL/FixJ family response regulator